MDHWYITTVLGETASAKNQRRHVRIGGKSASIKSQKALDYTTGFCMQAREQPLDGDLILCVRVWYRSYRPDLDIDTEILEF